MGTPLLSGHPLTRGLQAFFPLNEGAGFWPHDLVGGPSRWLTFGSSTPWGIGDYGAALRFNSANGDTIYNDTEVLPTDGATVAMLIRCNNSANTSVAVDTRDATPSTDTFRWFLPFAGTWYFDFGGNSGNNRVFWTPAASWFGRWHVIVGTAGGHGMAQYSDGVQVASSSAAVSRTNASPGLAWGRQGSGGPNPDNDYALWALWRRELTPTEVQEFSRNPWGLFAPPIWRRYFVAAVAPAQTAVPVSDVSAGSWTASTGSDLYAMLDETVADDTDYILSPLAPANNEAKVRLGPLTDPAVSTGHVINYRFYKTPDGSARGDLTVTLYAADGTTSIASQAYTDVAPGVVAGTFTLSGVQADAIPSADYATGLVIGVKANAP